MSNPTDTNQASEDGELKDRLTKLISQDGWVDIQEVDVEGEVAAIQAIIRTEKLKLLAEVRERVVGEDERIDIQSDYDKLDVPHPETDRYPGLYSVRQASRNLCRERQRTALTKLEAEL